MKRIVKGCSALLIGALLPGPHGGYADVNTVVPELGIHRFNVSIINQSSQTVKFLLRPKDGQWTEYSIAGGEKTVYSCDGCDGTFQIQVRTAETTVSYDLHAGDLYALRPSPTQPIFDVFRVQ